MGEVSGRGFCSVLFLLQEYDGWCVSEVDALCLQNVYMEHTHASWVEYFVRFLDYTPQEGFIFFFFYRFR